ncbi:MAG: deoxyribose-phosphate aldolase [Candidatus Methylacidiphilales bacterium]|nr:deoxyribose-phosphate aldolase [Candidatus Methylacidiphilales bacterium]
MEIATLIDHTLLKPEATRTQIEQLCTEAREHGFFSVCINPYWISDAKKLLNGSGVKVCTVIGFPLGAGLPQSKMHATQDAIKAGADEVDVVQNIGAAKEAHWNFIEHEIHEVVSAAQGKTVKVILETCLLTDHEIVECCKAAQKAGAHFVKTSTGFSSGGATIEAVALMRKTVGPSMGVKASGGIKDLAAAEAMVVAGANRLGTSAGVAIVKGSVGGAGY